MVSSCLRFCQVFENEQYAAARNQLERILAARPESPAVLYSLAQVAARRQQPAEAQRRLEQIVALPSSIPRDDTPALLFLAQIAEESQRFNEAIDWLAKVPAGDGRLPATIRQAVLLAKTKRLEAARALLNEFETSRTRERAQLISAEAMILRDAQRPQEAVAVLDEGLKKLPDQPELLYDYAMATERLDRLEDTERALRRLMELHPDNAHAFNALGYTLADRNIRLAEARSLIEEALRLAPDDAQIIDSMGWVLFRLGDYEGAVTQLQRAYALQPDAEVAAHLGEALWVSGRRDEARQLLEDARRKAPDNTVLQDTLVRLNVHP